MKKVKALKCTFAARSDRSLEALKVSKLNWWQKFDGQSTTQDLVITYGKSSLKVHPGVGARDSRNSARRTIGLFEQVPRARMNCRKDFESSCHRISRSLTGVQSLGSTSDLEQQ